MLRFWESRFTQIRPLKRGGGRRYYRPDDVDLLRGVRHLLYGEGYTIRGVQRILREEGLSFVQSVWRTGAKDLATLERPDDDEAAAEFEDEAEADAEDLAEGEDEDDLEDDDGETEAEAPSRPLEPSFFPGASTTAARADDRREPSIKPSVEPSIEPSIKPSIVPPAAAPTRLSVDNQSRQRLEAALGELVACRGLIQAVLTETPWTQERPGETK